MTACLHRRPAAKLVFEFSSENLRRAFLAMFYDEIDKSMTDQINAGFDYTRASTPWRWDGKGEPVVRVFRRRKLR